MEWTMINPVARPSAWLLLPASMALALFAYAHRDPLFPSICLLSLVGSYFHTWRATLPKRYPWLTAMLGLAALHLLCVLYYDVWLLNGEQLTYFRRFWYKPWLVSTSAMLQAITLVWTWHISSRSTTGFIFLAMGLITISSGNLLPSSHGVVNLYALFGGACLLSLFVLSGAMNGGRGQPFREQCRQSIVIMACIAIISAGTWYVSTGLQHAGQLLDSLLADFTSGSRYRDTIGAGRHIQIAHQRRVKLSRRVVATLSGHTSPVYLRTQVLTEYRQNHWTTPSAVAQWLPERTLHRQPLHADHVQDAREVRLHVDLQGAIPLPYHTAHFYPPKSLSCFLNEGAIVQCSPSSQLTSYTYEPAATSSPTPYGIGFSLRPPTTGAPAQLAQSLQHALTGPEDILVQLRPIARQIAGEDNTLALAAAQRIQDHFQQHYTYSLHVDLDPALDPIVDFVRHRRPAYCEYFASGMVLMLRALGIPARVVGGFLVWEYNTLPQQWIVRQRDAHAWVEVYDEVGQRWVGFDATPPFRQEAFSRTGFFGFLDQSQSWAELQVRRLIKRLYQIDFIAWVMRLRQLGTWFKILGLSLIIAIALGTIYRLWRHLSPSLYQVLKQLKLKWPTRHRPTSVANPVQAEAQYHFARVADLLRQRGAPILPMETLEDYLQRLQSQYRGYTDGPQWAQLEADGQNDRTWLNSTFIDELVNFSAAYHQLRFRPHPAAWEDQQTVLPLQERLNALRQATDKMQQIQRDSAAGQRSNK